MSTPSGQYSNQMPSQPTAPFPLGYGPPPPVPGNRPDTNPNTTAVITPNPNTGAPQQPQQPFQYPTPTYAAPPHPQPYGVPPQPQPYGAYPPPPSQYPGYYPPPPPQQLHYLGATIPDPNAPPAQYGGQKVPGYDPVADAEAIRKATKGFGADDTLLTTTLIKIPALQMDALADFYVAKHGKKLVDLLDSETKSSFGMGIHALATGPLAWDVELVNKALAGIGTNETLLNELILGRPSAELRLLQGAYRHRYGRDLLDHIKGDLSGKVERLFLMNLTANRPPDSGTHPGAPAIPTPVNQEEVAKDVERLFKAGQGKSGTDEMAFCEIIATRPQAHLSAVIGAYGNRYRSLTKVIKSEFSGHLRTGLLHIVEGAKPKRDGQGVWRDAKLIDKAMVGFGTRDTELVWRIVRTHWDPKRMEAVKDAYMRRTGKSLESRVASETSGAYKKLMIAMINGKA